MAKKYTMRVHGSEAMVHRIPIHMTRDNLKALKENLKLIGSNPTNWRDELSQAMWERWTQIADEANNIRSSQSIGEETS